MKKIIFSTAFLLGLLFINAQAPEKMSYQSTIRNSSGQILQNQYVAVRASILQGSETGTVVYSERITGTTNTNGLLSLEIGSGAVLSGTFSSINWSSGNYYLKTETDPFGTNNYSIVGTSQLLSVPYAMYAKSSGGGSSFTLPYAGTSSTDNVVPFKITNSSGTSNNAGYFENTSLTNSASAVLGINKSTGSFGAGVEGVAESNSNGNTSTGVRGTVLGTGTSGAGVYGDADNATGVWGNSLNGVAVKGVTNGTGVAGYFQSESNGRALASYGPIELRNINEGVGKVLTSDANGNATWQTPSTFSLPYSESTNGNYYAFKVINTNTTNGTASIVGEASGNGIGLLGTSGSSFGVSGESNTGVGVKGFSSSGIGGDFATDGAAAGVSGFSSDGPGGEFTSSTGPAIKANGNVDITGTMKIAGGNPGAGKVLTSDASGNATWQTTTAGLTLPYVGQSTTAGPSFAIMNDHAAVGDVAIRAYGVGSGNGIEGATSGGKGVYGNANSGTGVEGYSATGTAGYFSSNSGLALKTGTGGTEINGNLKITSGSPGAGKTLVSDETGNATWQGRIPNVFLASLTQTVTIPSNTTEVIQFNSISGEGSSLYDSEGYHVPKSGYYHFDVNLHLNHNQPVSIPFTERIFLVIKSGHPLGSRYTRAIYELQGTGSTNFSLGSVSFSTVLHLAKDHTVTLSLMNQTGASIEIIGDSYFDFPLFSGYLIN